MFSVTWRPGESSNALEHARRWLIKRRLPLFGFAWLGTLALWEIVLGMEERIGEGPMIGVLAAQTLLLATVVALCRAEPAGERVRPLAVATGIILGLSTAILFAIAEIYGEVLAFALLTLYMLAALLFAWGWKPELLLMLGTLIPCWFLVPSLELFVPPPEVGTAIVIGGALALAIAEGAARTFRISFLRRESENEMKRELEASRDAYRDLAEKAQDLIYTIDLEGRFAYVNEALARYMGVPASALVGRSSLDMLSVHPANPNVAAILERLAAGMSVGPQLFHVQSVHGPRWIEAVASSMRGPDGTVTGARGIGRDVTERKRATDALRESEERFRSAFGSASIGMAVVTLDGRAQQVNPALCEMLGYTAEEMRDLPFETVTHPDDVDQHAEQTRHLVGGDTRVVQLEERYVHRDGHVVWGLLSSSLVRSSDGTPLYLISQIQDITERKVAEAALRVSEERFRNVFENAPIGMAVIAVDGRTIQVNRALCDMLGYDEDELLRFAIQTITYPPDVPDSVANARRILDGLTPSSQIEQRYVHKDGRPVWCLLSASLLRNASGEPLYLIAQMQDITKRKQAEEALRDSEQRYRDLVESQQDLLVRVDPRGRISFANDSLCRTLGHPRDEVLGRSSLHFMHPDDRQAAIDAMRELASAPYRATVENRTPTPAGWRWFNWEMRAIQDERGAVTEIQSVGRDVTDRRNAEEALRASLEDLRRSEEKLRLLAQRQARIREEERKRLGFDLHDDVCQELVGVAILVASLRRHFAPLTSEAAAELDRIAGYLNEVVEHLRLLARELRPMLLRDLGLEGSFTSLVEGMSTPTRSVTARFLTSIPRLEEDTEVAVYRIAQEALANAVRHAHARSIVVTLAVGDDALGSRSATTAAASCRTIAAARRSASSAWKSAPSRSAAASRCGRSRAAAPPCGSSARCR